MTESPYRPPCQQHSRASDGSANLNSAPSYRTVGDLIDDLIEHVDEVHGVAFPRHWTGGEIVWAHSTKDIVRWLQSFANSNALWYATIPVTASDSQVSS